MGDRAFVLLPLAEVAADWVHPIADAYPVLRAYRTRLLARPSFARAVDGGRPYRHSFPPGAPDLARINSSTMLANKALQTRRAGPFAVSWRSTWRGWHRAR